MRKRVIPSSLGQPLEEAPDAAAVDRVEAERRLVEEEDRGAVEDAAGEVDLAAHPAGEGADRVMAAVLQFEQGQHLLDPVPQLGPPEPVEPARQLQVLLGRELAVERRLLEDEADVLAHRQRFGDDVVAVDLGAAAGRADQRRQHVDHRRLARPVGAEEAEELAAADVDVDRLDGAQLAVVLAEPERLDDGSLCSRPDQVAVDEGQRLVGLRLVDLAAGVDDRRRGEARGGRPGRSRRRRRSAPAPGSGSRRSPRAGG